MRALVYHGPGEMAWEQTPKPEVDADTDAIVRVDATTICGTDLHILKGDLGADITVNNGREDPREIVRSMTDGLGADVTIEAVGVPPTFELAVELARPGGRIA
jgi:alcohol dehydrogenase